MMLQPTALIVVSATKLNDCLARLTYQIKQASATDAATAEEIGDMPKRSEQWSELLTRLLELAEYTRCSTAEDLFSSSAPESAWMEVMTQLERCIRTRIIDNAEIAATEVSESYALLAFVSSCF